MLLVCWVFLLFSEGCTPVRFTDSENLIIRFIVDATPLLFPPARISAHLCVDKGEALRLSRAMSKNSLIHEIRDTSEFGRFWKGHDPFEHRKLYVVNLDCADGYEALLEANRSRMFVAPAKWLLFRNLQLRGIQGNETYELFKEFAIYPDSDVALATRLQEDFVRVESIYRPSPYREVIFEDRGNWTSQRGVRTRTYDVASRRRRNLGLTRLKSCLVMTDPDTINHLTDYHDKHVDPVTKANYPWMLQIASRMNATVTFGVENTWGYRDENGSWSGMIGELQRREIDIGGTATFFIPERIDVVQYIQLYTRTGSRFIFRQPLLSTVSNIFTLPFQQSVWLAIAIFLVLVFCLLFLSTKWEYYRGASPSTADYWKQLNPAEQTLSDNVLVVLGAVTQQGYSYEPHRVPSRIVTLMLLIVALSLYASYTANIVALLQTTTDSIQTPADLLKSPLKLGAQDVVYNRYYFKSFQDPIRKTIYEQKIAPKGHQPSWMSLEEGARRIKNGLFAFHGESGTVYKIMQETYQEEEKCGITEMDFLNVLYPLMVIQRQSPYLEIIKNGALLLRESGLQSREEYRLYTKKPKCHGRTSFISIGLTECYFALVTMGYGALLALVIFVFEILWYVNRHKLLATDDPTNIPPKLANFLD